MSIAFEISFGCFSKVRTIVWFVLLLYKSKKSNPFIGLDFLIYSLFIKKTIPLVGRLLLLKVNRMFP